MGDCQGGVQLSGEISTMGDHVSGLVQAAQQRLEVLAQGPLALDGLLEVLCPNVKLVRWEGDSEVTGVNHSTQYSLALRW